MKEIRLEDYPELKEELEELEDGDVLSFTYGDEIKYVAMSSAVFDELDQIAEMFNSTAEEPGPNVKVIAPAGHDLSYEEYEKVKKQIIKALDESFKPNPDKLN